MATLEGMAESMRLVAADCEADAMRLDGSPLTPLYVRTNFGNLYAQVNACATAIKAITEGADNDRA